MLLTYEGSNRPVRRQDFGTLVHSCARFLKLIPDERIVQLVKFESKDPAFAGAMTITWTLVDVSGGAEVTVLCENKPEGIRWEAHEIGGPSSKKLLELNP
jgi:uncharacterized protein YndB with AHSA1/START domain